MDYAMLLDKCKAEGYRDYRRGRVTCPYIPGGPASKHWLLGYSEAEKEKYQYTKKLDQQDQQQAEALNHFSNLEQKAKDKLVFEALVKLGFESSDVYKY